MASKIYTKTGDEGHTSLIGGTKVLKSYLRIEAYGTVDELNSFTGLCRDLLAASAVPHILDEVQDRLFTIGSSLACDPDKETKLRIPDLHETDIELLESEMDKMNEELPEMKSFILPGGHQLISTLHITRCVCRRAERCCVRMHKKKMFVSPLVIKYLNRLSDYYFILSRYAGLKLQVPEQPWKPRV